MTATARRLGTADGLSLVIPHGFEQLTGEETDPARLAVHVDPWQSEGEFRPTLTAQTMPLTPDRCTVPQLSALAITERIAAGYHVAACDVYIRDAGDGRLVADGRQIFSLLPLMDSTIVEQLWVTVRGSRAVTVTLQHDAGWWELGRRVFAQAVATVEGEFDGPVPEPDPATMPRLDPYVRAREAESGTSGDPDLGEIEYLGGIRAAQPFVSAGPPLDEPQLEAIRRGKLRRGADPGSLRTGGLFDDRDKLTAMGQAAHETFKRPLRQIGIEVRSDGAEQLARLQVFQGRDSAAVVASAPGGGTTFDVIPVQSTPIALVRWLGLAPAWTFDISDRPARTVSLDRTVLDARLTSSDAPPPEGAASGLARMWAQPWQVAHLHAEPHPPRIGTVILTPEAGAFRLAGNELTPLPSTSLLPHLLRLGGFDIETG